MDRKFLEECLQIVPGICIFRIRHDSLSTTLAQLKYILTPGEIELAELSHISQRSWPFPCQHTIFCLGTKIHHTNGFGYMAITYLPTSRVDERIQEVSFLNEKESPAKKQDPWVLLKELKKGALAKKIAERHLSAA